MRLWISDNVWFDFEAPDRYPEYQIIRSPVFIGFDAFQGKYRWWRPEPVLETRDRRIWYISDRGDAWFIPETGQWCLFTTFASNIVEDSQGSLWMLGGNDLYRLVIKN